MAITDAGTWLATTTPILSVITRSRWIWQSRSVKQEVYSYTQSNHPYCGIVAGIGMRLFRQLARSRVRVGVATVGPQIRIAPAPVKFSLKAYSYHFQLSSMYSRWYLIFLPVRTQLANGGLLVTKKTRHQKHQHMLVLRIANSCATHSLTRLGRSHLHWRSSRTLNYFQRSYCLETRDLIGEVSSAHWGRHMKVSLHVQSIPKR